MAKSRKKNVQAENGLRWLGSIYPVTDEILKGIELAKKNRWPVRIHINEPPVHAVAFYVMVPKGATVPIEWLETRGWKGERTKRG